MFGLETSAIPYKKVIARGKRMTLGVSGSGEVVVKVPPHTPDLLVHRFINTNQSWIQKQQALISYKKALADDEIYLFGKKYHLRLNYDKQQPSGCSILNDVIRINPLSPDSVLTDKVVQSVLTRYIKTSASHYILHRLPFWAEKMQIKYAKIQLRQQKSRWGSCSSTGTLNFNWRLGHAPPEVIDYVIIHELAHRREMNHSAQFWRIVATYDPAHRQHRGWLKREGRWVFPEGMDEA